MVAPLTNIWGNPHLLDHSTGLQTPLRVNGINWTESLLLDVARCQLLPGKPGLYIKWLGTLNLPLVWPLVEALTLTLDLRFYVLQSHGGYAWVQVSAYGLQETLDFRVDFPLGGGQNCIITMPTIGLPVDTAGFDCRFDLVVDRPDTEQQTRVDRDTIDIKTSPL